MNKEDNSVAITKVDAESFDDFLGLINKLAEYEKLAQPDEEPKIGCVGTAYPASPNITRTSEKSAINPSLTSFTFSLTLASLLCQLSTLRTFLFLKIIADAGLAKKCLVS